MTTAAAISFDNEVKPLTAASKLLIVYVFLLYSRAFEAAALLGFGNLYLMLAISAVALFSIFMNGGFLRAARTPAGIIFLAFTLWGMFILPFSTWRGESLNVLSTWLKSIAAYFIIVGLADSFATLQKVASAIGLGLMVSVSILAFSNRGGDRLASFGTLGNANEVAFHILLGLPFLMLLVSRLRPLLKAIPALYLLFALYLSLKTQSRAGLIMIFMIFTVSLLCLSAASKFKLIAVAVVGLIAGLASLDSASLERYKTIFHPEAANEIAASAKESADVRKYKLQQGIELTLKHPIFGVGMGVFIPASAELSASKGERQYWIASHNSYVQVSSETGFVGFFLLESVFIISLISTFRVNRKARAQGLHDIASLSLPIMLGGIILSIHFFFDAMAYDFYLPIIAGLSTVLVATTAPALEGKPEFSAAFPVDESPPFRSVRPPAQAVLSASAQAKQIEGGAVVGTLEAPAQPPAASGRNPYRFSRKRRM